MVLTVDPDPISCWRSDELGGPAAVTVEIDLAHLVLIGFANITANMSKPFS